MNLRFLQRMGAPPAEAVAAGAIDDVSNTVVQAALFGLTLFHSSMPTSTRASSIPRGLTRDSWLRSSRPLGSVIVVLTVPELRNKMLPGIRSALAGLWSVARIRQKRLELFGGTIGAELLYALALGATCLAYGVDLNLAELIFINTAASSSRAWCRFPAESEPRRRASRPGSSPSALTNPPHLPSPSPSACVRSTCRPSGATCPCAGSPGRATSRGSTQVSAALFAFGLSGSRPRWLDEQPAVVTATLAV